MSVIFDTCNTCRITNVPYPVQISGPSELKPDFLALLTRTQDTVSVSFLVPGLEYRITTADKDDITITCPAWPFPFPIPLIMQRAFVTSEHIGKEPLVSAAFRSDNLAEYLYTSCTDIDFWVHLYSLGLFTLPSVSTISIPNPREKFALILPCEWNMSRKMLNCPPVNLVVESATSIGIDLFKASMTSSLELIASRYSSTWITPSFIEKTIDIINAQKIDYYIFKLFNRAHDLVSISIGYRHKNSFMDFTAATLVRDKHSYGKILMFKQGDWLYENLGIRLWYLGFQLSYMTTLVRDDSAKKFTREEFQLLWNS